MSAHDIGMQTINDVHGGGSTDSPVNRVPVTANLEAVPTGQDHPGCVDWVSTFRQCRSRRHLLGPAFLSGNNGSWTNSDDVKNNKLVQHQKAGSRKERKRDRAATGGAPATAVVPKQSARKTVAALAPMVARLFFGPTGAKVAKTVVEHIDQMFGSGDYEKMPAHNSLVDNTIGPRPEFGAPGAHAADNMRIVGSDPIGALVVPAPGTFVCYVMDINPSNPDLFPRLTAIAQTTSQNRLLGLVWSFVSEFSEYIANGVMPSVAVGWSCDATQPPPTSWMNMQMLEGAMTYKASRNAVAGFECAQGLAANNWYFNRNSNMDASRPVQAYYQGRLFIGVNNPVGGPAAGTAIGSMRIAYDVQFKDLVPIARPTGFVHIERTGHTNAAPFGTAAFRPDVTSGVLAGTTVNAAGTAITFPDLPQGTVVGFVAHWTGTTGAAYTSPPFTFDRAQVVQLFAGNTTSWRQAPQNGVTATEVMLHSAFVATNGANQTVVMNAAAGAVLPTGTTGCTLMFYVLGNGLPLSQL